MHTPGPWAKALDDSWIYSQRTGDAICELTSENDEDMPLLIAAPDLYAAIKNSDDAHWTTAMRAAMAKAEGREP